MGVYTRFAPTSATDPTAAHLDGTATSPSANGNIFLETQLPHCLFSVNSVAMFHMAGTPGHRGVLQYLEVFDVSTQTVLRLICLFKSCSDNSSIGALPKIVLFLRILLGPIHLSNGYYHSVHIWNGRELPAVQTPADELLSQWNASKLDSFLVL